MSTPPDPPDPPDPADRDDVLHVELGDLDLTEKIVDFVCVNFTQAAAALLIAKLALALSEKRITD